MKKKMFFVTILAAFLMLMMPNISAVNSELSENKIIKDKYQITTLFKNFKNSDLLEEKPVHKLDFWFAFIIYYAMLIDGYFYIAHPIIYNYMPFIIPFILPICPMAYFIFIMAFAITLADYLPN